MRSLLACALLASLAPSLSWADGKRDLEDGIAFYENLDTDRAIQRLEAALASNDLGASDRARAYLYLGMVRFEVGNPKGAESAWMSAFELDLRLAAPEGTSPTTLEAMEAARAKAKATPIPGPKPSPTEVQPPPPVAVPPPVEPAKPVEDEGPNWLLWGSIGGGAVAAAVIITVIAVSAGGGGECNGVPGGCLSVSYTISP